MRTPMPIESARSPPIGMRTHSRIASWTASFAPAAPPIIGSRNFKSVTTSPEPIARIESAAASPPRRRMAGTHATIVAATSGAKRTNHAYQPSAPAWRDGVGGVLAGERGACRAEHG